MCAIFCDWHFAIMNVQLFDDGGMSLLSCFLLNDHSFLFALVQSAADEHEEEDDDTGDNTEDTTGGHDAGEHDQHV